MKPNKTGNKEEELSKQRHSMNKVGQEHPPVIWGTVKGAGYMVEEYSETVLKGSIYCPGA